METWLIVFVGITAFAVLAQAAVLTATFLRLRRIDNELQDLRRRLNDRVDPLLDRLDDILKTVQVNSHRIMGDVAAITETARNQTEKFNRVTNELSDRVRLQIIRVDELLARALGAVEEAGEKIERSLTGPMREAVAVIHGVKTALDILTQRRRAEGAQSKRATEEELFI
ncbi:MAG: hypothetical protein ACE5MH_07915 [Terriglobia bacterium]